MKNLRAIKWQITLMAGICLFAALAGVVTISALSLRKEAIDLATTRAVDLARAQAREIQMRLEVPFIAARTLAQLLSARPEFGDKMTLTRDDVNRMLETLLTRNPDFLTAYSGWEPNAFDGQDAAFAKKEGYDPTGRFLPWWTRGDDGKLSMEWLDDIADTTTNAFGIQAGDYYMLPAKTKKETVIDPYLYKVQGKDVLLVSLVAPVLAKDTFQGIAGVDVSVAFLQQLADQVDLFDGTARGLLVSHAGVVAGLTGGSAMVGKALKEVSGFEQDFQDYLNLLQKGEEKVEIEHGKLEVLVPIRLGHSDAHWGVILTVPEAKITEEAHRMILQEVGVGLLLLGLGMLLLYGVAQRLALPVTRLAASAHAMAEGDLTVQFDATPQNEVGRLGAALQEMAGQFRAMFRQVVDNARLLDRFAGELAQVSATMSESAEAMSRRASQSAEGAKRMEHAMGEASQAAGSADGNLRQTAQAARRADDNMNSIARASREASGSLTTVAAAAEETSANIGHVREAAERTSGKVAEVARSAEALHGAVEEVRIQCQAAQTESAQADRHARENAALMTQLAASAKEIGQAVQVVGTIAEQTNMLALNAAIEAAGAGEAGKGFAVVANEVKELARQTREATQTITAKIQQIQQHAHNTRESTQEVSRIIARINDANGQILQSVEGQKHNLGGVSQAMERVAAETREVSRRLNESSEGIVEVTRNVTELSSGIEQVTQNVAAASQGMAGVARQVEAASSSNSSIASHVAQMATATREMAEQLQQVHQATRGITDLGRTVRERAAETARISGEFNRMVARFRV